jgi:hypothetical protein
MYNERVEPLHVSFLVAKLHTVRQVLCNHIEPLTQPPHSLRDQTRNQTAVKPACEGWSQTDKHKHGTRPPESAAWHTCLYNLGDKRESACAEFVRLRVHHAVLQWRRNARAEEPTTIHTRTRRTQPRVARLRVAPVLHVAGCMLCCHSASRCSQCNLVQPGASWRSMAQRPHT